MGDPRGTLRQRGEHYDRDIGPVRSALGLRLALALLGFTFGVGGVLVFTLVAPHTAWAALFGALALIAATNVTVVSRRLRERARVAGGEHVRDRHGQSRHDQDREV